MIYGRLTQETDSIAFSKSLARRSNRRFVHSSKIDNIKDYLNETFVSDTISQLPILNFGRAAHEHFRHVRRQSLIDISYDFGGAKKNRKSMIIRLSYDGT